MSTINFDPRTCRVYQQELEKHIRWLFGEYLGNPKDKVDVFVQQRLTRIRGEAAAELLDKNLGLAGKRVLDVGAGWGELVHCCIERGALVSGVEPDDNELRISQLLLKSYGRERTIVKGVGEYLPFPNNSFDIVICHQVLEHVNDLGRVVSELIRVTKQQGYILVSVPNYLFPYEGHYRMKWFPLMPKWIGRLVLKANGRNPEFLLKHVHYTTYPQLMALWKAHNLVVRNMTEETFRSGQRKANGFTALLMKFIALRLKLFGNVTWLLRKPYN